MRKLHLLLLPAALLALVFGLAACGSDSSSESAEDKVVETIETAATSTDPADCKGLESQRFMEQTELSKGAEAVKSCEEDAEEPENDPDSVDVTNVKVKGSNATADVAFSGGSFDGQTLSVALVETDGNWKLDETVGFAKLDQERLVASLEESFESGDNPLDSKTSSCIGDAFRELAQPGLEETLISGNPQPLIEIISGCQQ